MPKRWRCSTSTADARRAHAHAHGRRGAAGPTPRGSRTWPPRARARSRVRPAREDPFWSGRPARSRGRSSTPPAAKACSRPAGARRLGASAPRPRRTRGWSWSSCTATRGIATPTTCSTSRRERMRRSGRDGVFFDTRRASAERTLGEFDPRRGARRGVGSSTPLAGPACCTQTPKRAAFLPRAHGRRQVPDCFAGEGFVRVWAAAGASPPRSRPWDPYTCAGPKATHPRGTRRSRSRPPASSLRDAKTLATVGMWTTTTRFVWAWRSGTPRRTRAARARGRAREGVRARLRLGGERGGVPHRGVNHAKFWKKTDAERKTPSGKQSKQSREYVEESGKFGADVQEARRGVLKVYATSGRVLTAHPRGLVLRRVKFSGKKRNPSTSCARARVGSERDPRGRRRTHHGGAVSALRADGETLGRAGADWGTSSHWDVKNGDLKESSRRPRRRCGARMRDGRVPPWRPSRGEVPRTRGTRSSRAPTAASVWEVVADGRRAPCAANSTETRTAVFERPGRPRPATASGHTRRPPPPRGADTGGLFAGLASRGRDRGRHRAAERRAAEARRLTFSKKAPCRGRRRRSAAGRPTERRRHHVLDAATLTPHAELQDLNRVASERSEAPRRRIERRVSRAVSTRMTCRAATPCAALWATARREARHPGPRPAPPPPALRARRTSCTSTRGAGRERRQPGGTPGHTRRAPLGFDAMGDRWRPGAAAPDVNAVYRARARAHLVTADDFGGVNVFNRRRRRGRRHCAKARSVAAAAAHAGAPRPTRGSAVGRRTARCSSGGVERTPTGRSASSPRPVPARVGHSGLVRTSRRRARPPRARRRKRAGGAGENASWARPPALRPRAGGHRPREPGTDGGR